MRAFLRQAEAAQQGGSSHSDNDPMYLETRKVSRKTPGDGKLEVTERTYASLAGAESSLTASFGSKIDRCQLHSYICTCDRSGGSHTHYFVQSDLFHSLRPEATVRLDLDGKVLNLIVTPLD